jgi:hypothetical protein
MDTQWKQVIRITLSSIKTLEDLTTRLEDLRDSETTLSQTVGINLEYVILPVNGFPCTIFTESAS